MASAWTITTFPDELGLSLRRLARAGVEVVLDCSDGPPQRFMVLAQDLDLPERPVGLEAVFEVAVDEGIATIFVESGRQATTSVVTAGGRQQPSLWTVGLRLDASQRSAKIGVRVHGGSRAVVRRGAAAARTSDGSTPVGADSDLTALYLARRGPATESVTRLGAKAHAPALGAQLYERVVSLPFHQRPGLLGIGQSTHGHNESFQLVSDFLELAKQDGGWLPRFVAFEANAVEISAINAALMGGSEVVQRTSDATLSAMIAEGVGFWTVATEAFTRLLEQFVPATSPGVDLVGLDRQSVHQAVGVLAGLAARWGLSDSTTSSAAVLGGSAGVRLWSRLSSDDRELALSGVARLVELVEPMCRDMQFTHPLAPAERQLVLDAVTVGKIALERAGSLRLANRDRDLAQVAISALSARGADACGVLVAHNAHVAKQRGPGGEMPMGGHLRAALGDGYFAVAETFGRGGFMARVGGARAPVAEVRLNSAGSVGSVGEVLGRIGRDILLALPSGDADVDRWLAGNPGLRSIGSSYFPDFPASAYEQPFPLNDCFDAIAFHTEATPSVRAREGLDEHTCLGPVDAAAPPATWRCCGPGRFQPSVHSEFGELSGAKWAPWDSTSIETTLSRQGGRVLRLLVIASLSMGTGYAFVEAHPSRERTSAAVPSAAVGAFSVRESPSMAEVQIELPTETTSLTIGVVLNGSGSLRIDSIAVVFAD